MSQRLWVVSELYFPEDTSTGYFLTGIAEGLAKNRAISAVCSQPTYAARGTRAPRSENRNGVSVFRCWSTTFGRDRLGLRAFNLATFTLSCAAKLALSVKKGDVVLAVTNPPTLPLAAALACWLRRGRLILLVHDVYPDAAVASGLLRSGSFLERLWRRVNRRAYKRADMVVAIGRDMETRLAESLLDGDARRVVVIPNWADTDDVHVQPRHTNGVLDELGLLDSFVVQYAGNMGKTHDLQLLLDAADRLARTDGPEFLMVGSGTRRQWLERELGTRPRPNVRALGRQPRERLSDLLNACDLAAFAFIPAMAGISVPSRMYNILAAGKPIVAAVDDESELARVVREENIGWVVPPGDVAAFCSAIEEAMADSRRRREMGVRCRKAAEERFAYSRIMDEFEAALDTVESP